MATITTQITNGPGVGELLDALKYAFNKRNPHTIDLTLSGHTMTFKVVGLSYESGADGMFILEVQDNQGNRARGFYDANRRQGHLQL